MLWHLSPPYSLESFSLAASCFFLDASHVNSLRDLDKISSHIRNPRCKTLRKPVWNPKKLIKKTPDTNWHHPHTLPFFHDTPPPMVFYGPLGNIIVKWEVCHFFLIFILFFLPWAMLTWWQDERWQRRWQVRERAQVPFYDAVAGFMPALAQRDVQPEQLPQPCAGES